MKLFQVGDRDDSNLYISAKMKAAAEVRVAHITDKSERLFMRNKVDKCLNRIFQKL